MNKQNNISEIRAEVLLNHLYPQLTEEWIVRNKGTFYRNYSDDILQLDEKKSQVSLSRDGFLRFLPQGLISHEDELRETDFKTKYGEIRERKNVLEELFIPLDTWRFRKSIHNEEDLAWLVGNKLSILLKEYYNVDIEKEENKYVCELMHLLPMANRLRGDFYRIGDILEVLLKYNVTTRLDLYNKSERQVDSQPMVYYVVWIPNLNNSDYKEFEKHLNAIKEFIVQWFIPFETYCMIEIKTENSAQLNRGMLLNYNTRL